MEEQKIQYHGFHLSLIDLDQKSVTPLKLHGYFSEERVSSSYRFSKEPMTHKKVKKYCYTGMKYKN
jgi:hypothetical protein